MTMKYYIYCESNTQHNMLRKANQSIGRPVCKWLFVYQELSDHIDKLIQHLGLNFAKRSEDTEALQHLQQQPSQTQTLHAVIIQLLIYPTVDKFFLN